MKEGMFLEMLVECLQKLLASDSISVNRNEVFFRNGKKVGEVDVVLRGRFGSANMVVGIECRDRRQAQGVNWIREIIGKKSDLADFGFNHWIATSSSGFKPEAQELAEKTNIELLVPGRAEPLEPDKGGPHTWMEWALINSGWTPMRMKAGIEHNTEHGEQIKRKFSNKQSWSTRLYVGAPGMELETLRDFLRPMADPLYEENRSAASKSDFRTSHTFRFQDLEGRLDGIPFKIDEIEILVDIYHETVLPKFYTMAFMAPNTEEVLGIIGVNEYKYQDNTTYMMIAIKPKEADKPVLVIRDSEGRPFANKVQFSVPNYPPGTPLRMIQFTIKK